MKFTNQIETSRLMLSPISKEDEAILIKHPSVTTTLFYTDIQMSVGAIRAWLLNAYEHWHKHPYGVWVIRIKESRQFIGFCSLRFDEEIRETILSYGILEHYRKKGYAFEAVSAVIQYGFQECSLNHIIANVKQDNIASIHLLEKLGMKKVSISERSYTYTKIKEPYKEA
ncbi:MAG: GNAT family N-acetyltransferase [Candidatus Amoebophilus sp.]